MIHKTNGSCPSLHPAKSLEKPGKRKHRDGPRQPETRLNCYHNSPETKIPLDKFNYSLYHNNQRKWVLLLSKVFGLEKVTRFFFYCYNII